jgi:hypothetical protein
MKFTAWLFVLVPLIGCSSTPQAEQVRDCPVETLAHKEEPATDAGKIHPKPAPKPAVRKTGPQNK